MESTKIRKHNSPKPPHYNPINLVGFQLRRIKCPGPGPEGTNGNSLSLRRGSSRRHNLQSPRCPRRMRRQLTPRISSAPPSLVRPVPRGNTQLHNYATIAKGTRNATGMLMSTALLCAILDRHMIALKVVMGATGKGTDSECADQGAPGARHAHEFRVSPAGVRTDRLDSCSRVR